MTHPPVTRAPASLKLGVERLLGEPGLLATLAGKRVGLIVNPTSVDQRLVHTVDRLLAGQAHGRYTLTALFAPEHGLHAVAPATQAQSHGRDPRTGLPVWSLYSETRRPTPGMLADIDVLIFDLQDVGVRFYTFIWTMYHAMAAAARQGTTFLVLDRPNPLGSRVDGPLLDPGLASFVGLHILPLQHGMTVGELALLFNAEYLDPPVADLRVVAMSGYDPSAGLSDLTLQWVPPSPNLPHRRSAWAHAATGLIDGTSLSQGIGTTLPFEWVGHPSISDRDAHRLASELNERSLPGVIFRPMLAIPAVSKCAGSTCGGVQMHLLDAPRYRPARTAVHLLSAALRHSQAGWLTDSDLHSSDHSVDVLWIDRLTGDREVRLRIDANEHPDRIVEDWEPAAREFAHASDQYRLYPTTVPEE